MGNALNRRDFLKKTAQTSAADLCGAHRSVNPEGKKLRPTAKCRLYHL